MIPWRFFLTSRFGAAAFGPIGVLLLLFFAPISVRAEGSIAQLGTLKTGGAAYELAASGGWAFVAAGTQGLKAVDLADSSSPALRATQSGIGTVGYIEARSLDEIYVLVRDTTRQEVLYDQALFVLRLIYDGEWKFTERSFTPLPSGMRGETLDLQHPKLNVTCSLAGQGQGRMVVLNVSNPDSPQLESTYNLNHLALDSVRMGPLIVYYAAGDTGYATQRLPGLYIPPYSNPDPKIPLPGYANRIEWEWESGLCYVTDGVGGLRVINPIDPHEPFEAGYYQLPQSIGGNAQDLYLAHNVIVVADGYSGVLVLDPHRGRDLNLDGKGDYRDVFLFTAQYGTRYDAHPRPLARLEVPLRSVRAVAPGPSPDLIVFVTEDGLLGLARFPASAENAPTLEADLNRDGTVNEFDLYRFLKR